MYVCMYVWASPTGAVESAAVRGCERGAGGRLRARYDGAVAALADALGNARPDLDLAVADAVVPYKERCFPL